MISVRYNFFSPRIGKNASSTTVSFFKEIDPNLIEEGHEAILDTGLHGFLQGNHRTNIALRLPVKLQDMYKFAFVRNPLDRFISAWKEFSNPTSFVPLKNEARLKYDIEKAQQSLTAFIDLTDEYKHIHWESQIDLMSHESKILVDDIYYFENLEEDLLTICEKVGIKKTQIPNIPHIRKSNRKSDYLSYYSSEDLSRIEKRYELDLNTFYNDR